MKFTFFASLLTASTLTGLFASASPANAFTWDNSWSQPTVSSKSQTGFDDAPFQQFVQAERVSLDNAGLFLLDPSQLMLKYDHEVAVHFINEGAGYRNQLAFETTGAEQKSGLVFNDISSAESVGAWGGDALDLGDSVNLGKVSANTQLNFWLRANGFNGGSNIFGTQTANNADGLQHVVAYAYQNYLLLGFEDLYGKLYASGVDEATGIWNESSDRDFNDAVFVVDIGEANVRHLKGEDTGESVPEPSATLALLGLGIASAVGLRRRQDSTAG